jgi:putative heme-binding domain-containing protein
VRLSEPVLNRANKLGEALLKMVDDQSIRVRYQLAFSLGEWQDRRAGQALARLVAQDSDNSALQTAVLSSAKPHALEILEALFARDGGQSLPGALAAQLFGLAVGAENQQSLGRILDRLSQPVGDRYAPWQMAGLDGLLNALDRRNISLKMFADQASPQVQLAVEKLDGLFQQARQIAADSKSDLTSRIMAARLLGRGATGQEKDWQLLVQLLQPQVDAALQKVALDSLKRSQEALVARSLVAQWNGFGPSLRADILNTLLARPEWTSELLAAIESGKISAREISPAQQQKLTSHSDRASRDRAQKLFAASAVDRQKVLKDFAPVKSLLGDPNHGAELYRLNCMTCHRLRGEGNDLGPDLGTMSDKPVESLLVAILDPNQAVESRYVNYAAVTKDGRELGGLITSETPNSITLTSPGGNQEVVLRSEIKTLSSSGLSLMPEGFENALKPQDLADLIAYIRASASRAAN